MAVIYSEALSGNRRPPGFYSNIYKVLTTPTDSTHHPLVPSVDDRIKHALIK